MSASAKSLRSKLVRKAYENPGLRKKLLPVLKKKAHKLSSEQRAGLAEAIATHREVMATETSKTAAKKNPTVEIKALPPMSNSQLVALLDSLTAIRQESETILARVGDDYKRIKQLEKEEKAGLAKIKEAGGNLAEKTNYMMELEKYLLKFRVVLQRKRPGSKQLMAAPDEIKSGKAGDLRNRILNTFEKEVADQILTVIEAAIEDGTHYSKAGQAIDIVAKTASVPPGIMKNAGLVDTVVSIKEWIVGGTNSIMQRILGFTGDLKKWLKGFVERTRIAKNSKDKALKGMGAIEKMMDELDKEVGPV